MPVQNVFEFLLIQLLKVKPIQQQPIPSSFYVVIYSILYSRE
jgi:hypothetical protein